MRYAKKIIHKYLHINKLNFYAGRKMKMIGFSSFFSFQLKSRFYGFCADFDLISIAGKFRIVHVFPQNIFYFRNNCSNSIKLLIIISFNKFNIRFKFIQNSLLKEINKTPQRKAGKLKTAIIQKKSITMIYLLMCLGI